MAIQSSYYTTDGTTRTYPSSKHIASKLHVAVYFQTATTSGWSIVESSQYELVNNSIVFYTAPVESIYSQIEIRVADTTAELEDSPSNIAIVAGAITDVINVSNNMTVVENVNNHMGAVTTVSANITNLNSIVSDVIPNLPEILLADENATIATASATLAQGYAESIVLSSFVKNVDTIADLATIDATTLGTDNVFVKDLDRGGLFVWSSTGTVNGGTVFAGLTGYWVRQYSGVVNVKWFGVKGDGVADDDVPFNQAVSFVKINGGELVDKQGLSIRVGAVNLSAPSKPFSIIGVKGKTKLIRKDDTVGTIILSTSSSVPFYLSNFDIDCKNDIYPNGNHGISIADMNGLRISGVNVSNYKNSAILVYGTVPNTFYDNIITDCKADGMTVANNGILLAELDRSGIIDCEAYDITGSPGYGLQLKNRCNYSFIRGGYAENCVAGVAFGQDISTRSVSFSSVANTKIYSCVTGVSIGYAYNNSIDVNINMNNTNQNAVDINESRGNSVALIASNIANLKAVVRARSGSADNMITCKSIDNLNTTGVVAVFDSGAFRNSVVVEKMQNPSVPSTVRGLVTDSSSNGNNSLELKHYPFVASTVISSGVVVASMLSTKVMIIDTEASSASDTLDTISGIAIDGFLLTIRITSNLRDVIISHNTGNILLNGSVNYTLDAVADTLTLMYNSALSKWVEVSRGNNT